MRIRPLALCLVVLFAVTGARAQTQQPASSIVVKAAKILDVRQGSYLQNAAIWIEGERIKEVGAAGDIVGHAPKNARVIDLGERTVLPGLIDCHTHLMSRMPGGDR